VAGTGGKGMIRFFLQYGWCAFYIQLKVNMGYKYNQGQKKYTI